MNGQSIGRTPTTWRGDQAAATRSSTASRDTAPPASGFASPMSGTIAKGTLKAERSTPESCS